MIEGGGLDDVRDMVAVLIAQGCVHILSRTHPMLSAHQGSKQQNALHPAVNSQIFLGGHADISIGLCRRPPGWAARHLCMSMGRAARSALDQVILGSFL